MTAETSPRPWVIEPDGNDQVNIYAANGEWVALLPHQCLSTIEEQQKANAALIVTAVNAHDALLSSLKALMNDLDTGMLVRDISRDMDPDFAIRMLGLVQRLSAAQAAIAKAEGSMNITGATVVITPRDIAQLMAYADEVDCGDVWNLGDPESWGHVCQRHSWLSLPAHSPKQARQNLCPECEGEREGMAGRSRFMAMKGA